MGPIDAKRYSLTPYRQIICNLMKLYDGERNLVLLVRFRSVRGKAFPSEDWTNIHPQVNASTNDETGLGEELSTMGVRKPGLRVVGHEMQSKARYVAIATDPVYTD